jgi:hypothetical protein
MMEWRIWNCIGMAFTKGIVKGDFMHGTLRVDKLSAIGREDMGIEA